MMPSGKADLGVVKSTLREEPARRALLFSKVGRLLAIEILKSVLRGASAAMTTLPDFDINCGSAYNEG
jgi:hypothetical protein